MLVLLVPPPLIQTIHKLVTGGPGEVADFSPVYAAGSLALSGRAADAYNDFLLTDQIRALFPQFETFYPWFYPPFYFFPLETLARLPYDLAFYLWVGLTGTFFAWAMRPLVANRREAWLLATLPAVFVNFWIGQNGFLVAGLLALFVTRLHAHKSLAGVALGVLSFKPQFGVLLPIFLLVRREFRVFLVAAAVVVTLAALSFIAYGETTWANFLKSSGTLAARYGAEGLAIARQTSVTSTLVNLGAHHETALAVQTVVAVLVIALFVAALWRREDPVLQVALSVVGAFLISPYSFPYDWVALLVPVAILVRRAEGGWLAGERPTLALLWLMSALNGFFPFRAFGAAALVPVVLLFLVLLRRAWRRDAAIGAPAPMAG